MRRRKVQEEPTSPRGDVERGAVPPHKVYPVKAAAELVTLDDPKATFPNGAIVRLQPWHNASHEEIEVWRARVAKTAAAVRVLPIRRDAEVPKEIARSGPNPRAPREEVERLLSEMNDPQLTELCHRIMAEEGM